MVKVQTVPEEVVRVQAEVHHKVAKVVQADQAEMVQAEIQVALVVQKVAAVAEVKVQVKQAQVDTVQ